MAQTIVFANQKGGVGKTTSTVNLGACFAERGKRTLLVDFDPQGNLSSALGVFKPTLGMYQVITGVATMSQVICQTEQKLLDVAPSNVDLSAASLELAELDHREFYLKKALSSIKDDYDFILIDCPPSLDLLTINGVVAAEWIIIPVQCEFFAAQGFFNLLFTTIASLQKNLNPSLKVLGVVFTMYDARTKLGQEVIQMIVSRVNNPSLFFKTVIPRNIKLAEAPSHGQPITLYASTSSGAHRYRALANEALDRV